MKITLQAVTKEIHGVSVLNNANCEFLSGNIYGVVGPNGSGKTMLLRVISGLIRPTHGNVFVDGQTLHKDISFPPNAGIIIEKPELLPYFTGYENLKYLAEIRRLVSNDQIQKFMKMFALDPNSKQPVKKYSLGMKQKLGVIQAIMENPDVLILDEPFNALDESTVAMLHNLFLEYKLKGKLIILTSHHYDDISAICNQVLTIQDGTIQKNSTNICFQEKCTDAILCD